MEEKMNNKDIKISALFLLLTFILAIAGLTLALVLHWTEDTSFMPWSNYVSDLSVGPNGSSIVYIIMMLGMAVLLVPFFFFNSRALKTRYNIHRPGTFVLIIGIISSLDIIIMVFFPLDTTRPIIYITHIITGVILSFCMTGFLGTYGWVFLKLSEFPKTLGLLACTASFFCFIFAILLALTEIFGIFNQHVITYLFEWAAFSLFAVWMLLTSLHLLKKK
jgi:hypothetical protein